MRNWKTFLEIQAVFAVVVWFVAFQLPVHFILIKKSLKIGKSGKSPRIVFEGTLLAWDDIGDSGSFNDVNNFIHAFCVINQALIWSELESWLLALWLLRNCKLACRMLWIYFQKDALSVWGTNVAPVCNISQDRIGILYTRKFV